MQALNDIGHAWLPWLELHLLEFSLFVALIWIADRSSLLTTTWRYRIWLLALLKLFIPPFFSTPAATAILPVQAINQLPLTGPLLTANSTATLSAAGLTILLLGGFVIFIFSALIIQNLRLRRSLSAANPIAQSNQLLLPEHLRHDARLQILTLASLGSPVLTGFRRHKLYLPASWQSWTPAAREAILAHELAHIRHRDGVALLLQSAALALFGYFPLVWLMHRKLQFLRELRCDEAAVRESKLAAHEYGKQLLDVLTAAQPAPSRFALQTAFAESRQNIKKRFQHILTIRQNEPSNHRWLQKLIFAGLCLLLLPASYQLQPGSAESDAPLFDTPPMPVGGFSAIQQHLVYPAAAKQQNLQGRVIVDVSVDTYGNLKRLYIKSATEKLLAAGCGDAALAALRGPQWQPASLNGEPVDVTVTIPVIFKMQ